MKKGKRGRAGHHLGQDRPQQPTESRQQPLGRPAAISMPRRLAPVSGPHSWRIEQGRGQAPAEEPGHLKASTGNKGSKCNAAKLHILLQSV